MRLIQGDVKVFILCFTVSVFVLAAHGCATNRRDWDRQQASVDSRKEGIVNRLIPEDGLTFTRRTRLIDATIAVRWFLPESFRCPICEIVAEHTAVLPHKLRLPTFAMPHIQQPPQMQCEEQTALRRSVIPRQIRQLLVETLKTEIEVERRGIFLK